MAGRIGAIAQAPYVASKWALEGVSEQMAQELAPFGIRVVDHRARASPSRRSSPRTSTCRTRPAPTTPSTAGCCRCTRRASNHATDPFEVAETIRHAIETDAPRLRYTVSWGGPELVEGRARMTDEEWVAIGLAPDDAGYIAAFGEAFGLDIST